MKKAIIYTDGGASPNPGPASIGAVLKDDAGNTIGLISQSIGVATNNEAEYRAVIAALEMAAKLRIRQVELRSDSQWLVRQVTGEYKVKAAAIRPLYIKVKQMQEQFDECLLVHIPRELNEAHKLAGQAI
jgi:ribonuclease HI